MSPLTKGKSLTFYTIAHILHLSTTGLTQLAVDGGFRGLAFGVIRGIR